ncbi:hypothetical protein [Ferruginibacter sp.]|uniref:hypothetical protein n=1 Tax=Ferruginibacter sp. TaxID=1940288 RepID=UPI00265A2DD7|nr:hypothetical protein [Ferruginibacter sp.]
MLPSCSVASIALTTSTGSPTAAAAAAGSLQCGGLAGGIGLHLYARYTYGHDFFLSTEKENVAILRLHKGKVL